MKNIPSIKLKYCCAIALACLMTVSCNKSPKEKTSGYMMSVDVAYPTVDSVLLHKTYPGYLSAQVKVDIVARVNGFLEKINYHPGDYVKKGQVLFIIEPTSYKETVTQAEAQLASAVSQNRYARNNYLSMKEAALSNAVSQIDLIQAQSNWMQSEAAIKEAKANLAMAQLNLGYCYVKAPFSGHITKSTVDVGNYLNGSASAQILATLYDDVVVNAYFTIEDNQYLRMVAAQQKSHKDMNNRTVQLSFSESLPHSYSGYLDYLAPMVDLSTGSITLRAKVKNPYGELKSGMYADISLPYEQLNEAVLVKAASIGTDQSGKYIYVVNDSDRVVYTPIQIGDSYQDTLRIVTKGITVKQRYVTQALQKVRDGMRVSPILSK